MILDCHCRKGRLVLVGLIELHTNSYESPLSNETMSIEPAQRLQLRCEGTAHLPLWCPHGAGACP